MLTPDIRMSFCPIDVQTGFIQLSGPITQDTLTSIQVNSSPFTASFAPRQNKPRIQNSFIEDGTNNTILYNSVRYQLDNLIQICKPTHSGYALPGATATRPPEMELILTYTNLNAGGSYPTGILVILPIYVSEYSVSNHANYLLQFLSDSYPVATLQTLFTTGNDLDVNMKALSYMTGIDIVEQNNKENRTYLRCFYFSKGIEIAPREYASLKAIMTGNNTVDIPNFHLPFALRYMSGKTVLEYTIRDGKKVPTNMSDTGMVARMQLSTASQDFRVKFQYFTKPIVVTTKDGATTCPYYPTSKYKCVPFNALRDLSGNQVIPGGVTLDGVLNDKKNALMTTSTTALGTTGTGGVSNAFKWLGIAIAIIAGLILLAGLIYLFKYMGRKEDAVRTVGTAASLATLAGSIRRPSPSPSAPLSSPSALQSQPQPKSPSSSSPSPAGTGLQTPPGHSTQLQDKKNSALKSEQ
jgi:hypothetical protein